MNHMPFQERHTEALTDMMATIQRERDRVDGTIKKFDKRKKQRDKQRGNKDR